MLRSVEREIRQRSLLSSRDRVLVGVSGGPDSVALLAILAGMKEAGGLSLELGVAHLDHGSRGASGARDALFAAAFARARGVEPFLADAASVGAVDRDGARPGEPLLPGPAAAPRTSLRNAPEHSEARWRDDRFSFLRRAAGAWRADAVALGQHRDDQAETVLMRLARGAGPAALAGMAWRRADGIVRPLLGLSRDALRAFVDEAGLPHVQDASNLDQERLRNRVRTTVLPALGEQLGVDMRARLARLAEHLRVATSPGGEGISPAGAAGHELARLDVLVAGDRAGDLVHAWAAALGVRMTSAQVESTLRIARRTRPSGRVDLGRGVELERDYDRLRLRRAAAPRVEGDSATGRTPAPVDLPREGTVLWGGGWQIAVARQVAADLVAGGGDFSTTTLAGGPPAAGPFVTAIEARLAEPGLLVRVRRPGDRMPCASGRRKLSDLMIERRLPMRERAGWPVVESAGTPVWVPGVALAVFAGADRQAAGSSEFLVLRAKRLDLPGRGCCDTRGDVGVTCRDPD